MKKGSKKQGGKTIQRTVRFSEREWHRVVFLAKTYAGGKVAKWIRHGAINAERTFLK